MPFLFLNAKPFLFLVGSFMQFLFVIGRTGQGKLRVQFQSSKSHLCCTAYEASITSIRTSTAPSCSPILKSFYVLCCLLRVYSLMLLNLRWGLLSVLGDCCPFSGDSCAFTPYGKVHFA
jgi:hypothetical protein